jgi:Carbamoylphosphate synthase small subunit
MVFNTAMTGYQETLTDPSYCRQIVAMTAPHIGNTGVNDEDPESRQAWVSGYVVREPARLASSWRATRDLDAYLRDEGVTGIAGPRHQAADPAGARAGGHARGDQHGGDQPGKAARPGPGQPGDEPALTWPGW